MDPETEIKAINARIAQHRQQITRLIEERKTWEAQLKEIAQRPKDAAKAARRVLELEAMRLAVVEKMSIPKVAAITGLPAGSLPQVISHLWRSEYPDHYRMVVGREGSDCLQCMRTYPPPF